MTDLRTTRFNNNVRAYETELKARFNNLTPASYYQNAVVNGVPWNPNIQGNVLPQYVAIVRTQLAQNYAQSHPGHVWHTFDYPTQSARSNFGPKVHDNQQRWFWPVPRCLKCRVIHNYVIDGEDMEEGAKANVSLQCAEDVVYGKLRELGNGEQEMVSNWNI